eukprot:759255-Rhodomonas_salina.3
MQNTHTPHLRRCEIKCTQTFPRYTLYQPCVLSHLISGAPGRPSQARPALERMAMGGSAPISLP